ncbi:MAG: electron transport complex subunit RsxD [Gammaproteobacteria bacterium]|nr:electron transport complex subunit RsxD [Gammaproteobacteria bacterium]MCP5137213.1 electron transport complex subunit RsxD [Gammaproteobacteria bacterium]
MQFTPRNAPFLVGPNTVSALMRRVSLALVPGILAMFWYFGIGVLINLILAACAAMAFEALMLRLRGRPIAPAQGSGLNDGSALLTGLLLGLCLPPLAPWWIPVLGAFTALVLAKHLYGGLGFNPFNPAMIGYVVLLVSFPREMTQWLPVNDLLGQAPSLGDSLSWVFTGAQGLDAYTQATPLDHLKTELGLSRTVEEIISDPKFGGIGGTGWEWINLAYLLGGAYLIKSGDIDWRIPGGMLSGIAIMATLFVALDGDAYRGPAFHLFSGAAMLGAFFIATDPVSASTTPKGRIYYGLGIGVLVYLIRTWGGYPDGVAFAVLLMNIAAPTIDYYTQPRTFGEGDDLKGPGHD